MNRHDMLMISSQGILFARRSALELASHQSQKEISAIISSDVPAIVKRQDIRRTGWLEVGFSSHKFFDGSRIRLNTIVPLDSILKRITPFEAIHIRRNGDMSGSEEILDSLLEVGRSCGMEVGVYGSAALQLITAKPYFTKESDYDIYLRKSVSKARVEAVYEEILRLERFYQVTFDCEMEWGSFAIKLKELFLQQKTVLCKGFHSVKLINIDRVRGDLLC